MCNQCLFSLVMLFWLHLNVFFYSFRGGLAGNLDSAGENGTVTGRACPKGLYGIFCEVDV